jgi:hypothetical protein
MRYGCRFHNEKSCLLRQPTIRVLLDKLPARLDHIAHQTSYYGTAVARVDHKHFKVTQFHKGGGSSNLYVALQSKWCKGRSLMFQATP